MASRLLRTPLEIQPKSNRAIYAFFFARSPFNASAKRDLYRFAVFSVSVPLRIALSNAENVGDVSFSAAATSPELSAVRSRRIAERTRVRFI